MHNTSVKKQVMKITSLPFRTSPRLLKETNNKPEGRASVCVCGGVALTQERTFGEKEVQSKKSPLRLPSL